MQKKFSLLSIKNEQIKEYNLLLEWYLWKGKIEDSNKQLNEGLVWNKKINIKLNCGHFFHSLCLSDYIKLEKYECPICKTNINQDLEEIKQKTKDILKSSFSRRNSH